MKILPRSDRTLQLSRRLDWRFLLPDPSLRRVAFWGSPHDALATALADFCETLTIFAPNEPPSSTARDAAFDLVVLTAPAFGQLECAQQSLAPQGYLYAEVQHAWHWRAARTAPTPNLVAWQTALARLGFIETKTHWHRPCFERALQIIPLHEKGAMDFVFQRGARGMMSQLVFAAARSLINRPWLAYRLQCVSIVARKQ